MRLFREHSTGVGLGNAVYLYVCMLFYLCCWCVGKSMENHEGYVKNNWQLLSTSCRFQVEDHADLLKIPCQISRSEQGELAAIHIACKEIPV